MPDLTFQIELYGGEPQGELMRFEPGGRLKGQAELTTSEGVNCRRVVLRVGWHTRTPGEPDQATVAEVVMASQPLNPQTHLVQPFDLDLPAAPWSYTGQMIQIIWEVKLVVDMPLMTDFEDHRVFLLAPGRLKVPVP
jgi:hypothetical protein